MHSIMPLFTLPKAWSVVVPSYYAPRVETTKTELGVPQVRQLPPPRDVHAISFPDQTQHQVKMWVNMVSTPGGGIPSLPVSTNQRCWWCRSAFLSFPLGCPVRYYKSSAAYRTMLSDNNLQSGDDYFETEGIFCSLSCVKAYIASQPSALYANSLSLLSLLQRKLYGRNDTIPTAPSWKLLPEYGGHLTREEWSSSKLVETPNMRRPLMLPINAIFT